MTSGPAAGIGCALLLSMVRPAERTTVEQPVVVSGLAWAAVGVVAFSMTFPATVFALRGFDPVVVGAGRTVGAAVLAAAALFLARARRPRRDQLSSLLNVAIGCGIGFGLLSALALTDVSASHAAVVGALLPVATAIMAVMRAGERPAPLFWLASLSGAAAVTVFVVRQGFGAIGVGDALLLVALVIGGLGYAEGGRLARALPGWQVVSWGVLLALPVALPLTVVFAVLHPPHPSAAAWAGLLYVATISTFFGFFAWYRGLATAGIARASQLQLAQPFLTLGLAAWLLGERPGADAFVTAVVVILCVVVTQRSRHRRLAPAVAATAGRTTG
jgi:drug/metabolite transporter (DMT)-like permease